MLHTIGMNLTFEEIINESIEKFNLTNDQYCKLVQDMPTKCRQNSLLSLWNYDEKSINDLDDQDIVNKINDPGTKMLEKIS